MPARQPSRGDDSDHAGVPVPAAPSHDPRLIESFDDIPTGIIKLDADLHVTAANTALATMLGVRADDLVGRSLDQLLTLPARILFQTHVYPALRSDGRVEEVFLMLAGKDEAVPALLNVGRSEQAADDGYTAVLVRIRARSQWEQELLAASRALEQEQRASRDLSEELASAVRDLELRHADDVRSRTFRDAFVGVVSHELRTPITTIFGMSHLLRERHETMAVEAVTAGLFDIESEAERLRRLTEDLLVLSRAEAGHLEVAPDPLVIGHLLSAVVREESERAEGHRFEVEINSELPLVLGEATYVEQVARNFLSNAVKYSPAGSAIRTTASAEDGGVAVRISDEGKGFGDEPPDQLWELFFRTNEAIKQAPGAGIGLFVARELVRSMGGRVWAKAAEGPGGGAEFGFWLPAMEIEDD